MSTKGKQEFSTSAKIMLSIFVVPCLHENSYKRIVELMRIFYKDRSTALIKVN